ncbi:MAG: HPr family phosphocarrier protein [Chitinivibrionales bacterium]|nr:HPr family phosphocarrier protein [Chitinivibrionales bacterium]
MKQRIVKIKDQNGLHLRAAAKIADTTKQFESKVTLCNDDKCASGSSVIELLMLEVGHEDKVKLQVEGKDEELVFKELSLFFVEGAGI